MKKTKIEVTSEGYLRGSCNCSWRGLSFSQKSGLSAALQSAQEDLRDHTCIPKVKKTRKKAK